ncbi:60s ribosomal protein l19 [Trichosporon asahii var. asahii CBS 8904]|uniref:Large ribosomal subunit protein uL11m n=2 Tax=Trichosporon asahii var. asahii TaxID=189963 RepID=K1VSI7_TRIAC|nr:60s ribosomal protein l19, precursor [Trichosporon asahii var. asahii CBS 2479]EJT52032.1 60s ribosomal protein l19, precursor [Trichosporon asahii var. asahii CBS 2479]EKD02522.1 60s ribosomal protein l19 [Trichosporon asahii var. asahii CBS 8904]
MSGKAAVTQIVKLLVPAGKATPSPPVGPALGARAVKAIDFCKEFNARTAHFKPDVPIPTLITINPDRTFSFTFKTPPVSYLLKKAAKIDKGSGAPGSDIVGEVSLKHVYEIAKVKCMDDALKALGEERVARSIVGSAKSLGINVVP